jgi:RNA polymerase sigma-70 factor, ECF subfamily
MGARASAESRTPLTPEAEETNKETGILLRRAQGGEECAFEEIVRLFSHRICGFCHRIAGASQASDLAQEVFVKLYLALPGLDPSRPLAPYLFRTAHNHCIDWLRKRRLPTVSLENRDEGEAPSAAIDPPDEGGSPEDLLLRGEVRAETERAFDELPSEYRSVLLLRHIEGLAYDEIAEALDLPLATVKTRIHRGRERLKQRLREYVVSSGRGQ